MTVTQHYWLTQPSPRLTYSQTRLSLLPLLQICHPCFFMRGGLAVYNRGSKGPWLTLLSKLVLLKATAYAWWRNRTVFHQILSKILCLILSLSGIHMPREVTLDWQLYMEKLIASLFMLTVYWLKLGKINKPFLYLKKSMVFIAFLVNIWPKNQWFGFRMHF